MQVGGKLMNRAATRRGLLILALSLGLLLLSAATAFAVGGGGLWTNGGQNLHNTRNAKTEAKISADNVADLVVAWSITTGGDVSATPAVDGQSVYFPDWAGNLYKADRDTGEVIWSRSITAS